MSENESIKIRESYVQNPLVTIAIPTYKRDAYLKEALDSALNQDNFHNYEVLVCDNNPDREDETETLISSYKDDRISYYKNINNIGIVGNWNQLYKLAKGEWVVMLHDDDLLSSFFLDYIFNRKKIYKNGDLIFPSFTSNLTLFQKSDSESIRKITYPKIWDFLTNNLLGPPLGMIMKKGLLHELGYFTMKFYPSPDYALYVEALLNKKKIVKLLGEPMAYYRITANLSLQSEIQISFVKNILDIGQYISRQSSKIFRPLVNFINRVSSFNAAKAKLKQFPDNQVLQKIERETELNSYQKIFGRIISKILFYRRLIFFPNYTQQYETK